MTRVSFARRRLDHQEGEMYMEKNLHIVLNLLKRELEFLERGGYKRSPASPWRAPYMFEESPSCPNHLDRTRQTRCEDCWLMQFVPNDLHSEQIPCRFVPLTPDGLTVDTLYRCATRAESEEALRAWLRQHIREIEREICEARAVRFEA
jgi:hypothetical protein